MEDEDMIKEPGLEAPAEAAQEAPRSRRDLVWERLRAKFPDREFADDEAMFGQISDDYDDYEKQIGDYRDREERLVDLFTRDPRSAQFITDMTKGKDVLANVVDLIGIDNLREMLEDPQTIEKYAEENAQYLDRVARQKDLEDQWKRNTRETLSMLEAKKGELGLDDETIDAVGERLKEIVNDAVVGIVKPEAFDLLLKAANYDSDVAAAGMEGEIRGRNEKAEAMLRKPERGDGVPALSGANNSPAKLDVNSSLFDLADAAR